jgi:hypothetical protein
MSTLLTDVPSGTGGGPANPIPQEVREKINEYADKYAFRVPYDGTNNFYDEEALKHFLAGAEYGYSLALPRIKELEEAVELLTEVRQRLLIDLDDNGEPRSSMADLMQMWDKVNKVLLP